MRTIVVGAGGLLMAAALTAGALAWTHAAPGGTPHSDVVATLPLPTPSPTTPPAAPGPPTVGPRPHLTLPEQSAPRSGQVYLGWRLLSADTPPDTLTLRWDGTDDPELPGCGSTPIAVEIRETSAAIRIGLIGPIPPDQPHCLANGRVAIIDVRLARPAGHRTVYRLTS